MARLKREANFSAMLIGLLIALIIGPVLLEAGAYMAGITIQTVLAITLIVSIWSAIDSKGWFYAGITLAIINGSSTIYTFFIPSFTADVIGLTSTFLFCALSIAFVTHNLLEAHGTLRITPNILIGAVSVYLLLGIGFAVLNMLLELLLPGSFKGLDTDGDGSTGLDMIYYSFVTMTTLGYGDVVPVRPLARATAYIGAVVGQFYIAVLVAGLVGAFITQRISERDDQ